MMPDRNDRNNHVCPVERAGILDYRIRRWLQDPQKILRPYIKEGMTILDIGCGPGFFSIDMAQMRAIKAGNFDVLCNGPREFKRNIFLVINHSMAWREIYEK